MMYVTAVQLSAFTSKSGKPGKKGRTRSSKVTIEKNIVGLL